MVPFLRFLSLILLFAGVFSPLFAETDEEREWRILLSIDRLEAEGWVDSVDLAHLREAAKDPLAHCAYLDAWIDELACPDDGQPLRQPVQAKKFPLYFQWRGGYQTTAEHDQLIEITGGKKESVLGEFGLNWRGNRESYWKERVFTWSDAKWRITLGQERSNRAMSRGAAVREDRKGEGQEFLSPGGSYLNGVTIQRALPFYPIEFAASYWGDGYKGEDSSEHRYRLAEGRVSGELKKMKSFWWISFAAQSFKNESYDHFDFWGAWRSKTAQLWCSWSPLNGGIGFHNPLRGTAASIVVQHQHHRMELAAAGKEWGSSSWRLVGAIQEPYQGYRIRIGPLLSLSSHTYGEWRQWRGEFKWSGWENGSDARWRTLLSLTQPKKVWDCGGSLMFSSSRKSRYNWARVELKYRPEKGWLIEGRYGPAWRTQYSAEGELLDELFDWSGVVKWPLQIGWKNDVWRWSLYWRDLIGNGEQFQIEHSFRWREKNGDELYWRIRWPIGEEEMNVQLLLEWKWILRN